MAVLAASEQAGISDPLDNAWREIPAAASRVAPDSLTCDCYKLYGRGERGRCYLSVEVPIRRFFFETDAGDRAYRMGQCPRCRAIYWSDLA